MYNVFEFVGNNSCITWGVVGEQYNVIIDEKIVCKVETAQLTNIHMGDNVAVAIENGQARSLGKLSKTMQEFMITTRDDGTVMCASRNLSTLVGKVCYPAVRGTRYFKAPTDFKAVVGGSSAYIPLESHNVELQLEVEDGITYILYGIPDNGVVTLVGGIQAKYQGFMSKDTDSLFAVSTQGVRSLGLGMTVSSTLMESDGEFLVSPDTHVRVYVDDWDVIAAHVQLPPEVSSIEGEVVFFPYGLDGVRYYYPVVPEGGTSKTADVNPVSKVREAVLELSNNPQMCEQLDETVEEILKTLPDAVKGKGNILVTVISLAASLSGAEKALYDRKEQVRSVDALPSDIL